jgi:tetratricopeptide (TPR) repeat protein
MANARSVSPQPVTTGVAHEPVQAALGREDALFSRRRYDDALGLLTDLLGRADLTARQRFEALWRKAEVLERLLRPRQAVTLLREISRAYPDEALGHSLLGEYLYRICDDGPGALRALNRALRVAPKDADSLWWKGQVYHLGFADLRRARRAYLAALEADPGYDPAMDSLAAVCEAEGKWIEAIDWRKRHFREVRSTGDLTGLADLYLRLGHAPAAMKYARSAVRRSPRQAAAWLHFAKAHAAGGRPSAAVEGLRRFARLANATEGPFVTSRDFGLLEPILDRPGVRALLPRLPVQ